MLSLLYVATMSEPLRTMWGAAHDCGSERSYALGRDSKQKSAAQYLIVSPTEQACLLSWFCLSECFP